MTPDSRPVLSDLADGVLRLTLNRPQKRNALDPALVAELVGAVARADGDDSVRVVCLAGVGKDFCAGADLASLHRLAAASVGENLADAESLANLYLSIRRCKKPVIALVHGRALAGGAGLATACDLVVAEEAARFGYPEIHLGFVPAMVMGILRRSVSEKVAFELVTLGRIMTAQEALSAGLVNRVVADGDLDSAGGELARELAGRSASAIQLCKRLLYHQDGMTYETAIRAGADVNVIARMSEDARAGIAAFLSERTKEGG